MRLIPLTQGKFAKVDDEDFERVSQIKWCYHENGHGNGYAENRDKKNKKTFRLHRFVLDLDDDKMREAGLMVDHIDGDHLNNQKENLRVCTNSQNQANRKRLKARSKRKYTSIYKGVYKSGRKWQAAISKDKNRINLGAFPTEQEAALAYNEAALFHFGEFARLNPVHPPT